MSEATESSTQAQDGARQRRKIVQGRVKSAKMQKTVVVEVIRLVRHPKYGKYMRRTSKFYVDDPNREAREGDLIEIMETRPLSRLKRWRLVRIIERSKHAGADFHAMDPSAEIKSAEAK